MVDSPENPEKDQGGRPPHQPTKASREQVAIAAGAGNMTHEEIAIGLGISRPTLEKHYAYELSHGAYAKRLKVLEAMYKLATRGKGNVSAQKAYIAAGEPRMAAPPLPPDKPEKPLGKKEQADLDAKSASKTTEWGPLLSPPGSALQ